MKISLTFKVFAIAVLLLAIKPASAKEEDVAHFERLISDLAVARGDNAPEMNKELDALRREALVKNNPLLNRHPILFVTRKQYRSDHHNTATLFQPSEINTGSYDTEGDLKLLDVADGSVRTLLDPGPNATVRDPDVSFDGERIVFSMRKGRHDFYHIYTINADGTNLRQLTSAPGVSDIDPAWLPDGDIVFSSSREPKYCMCNRHIMANLYRMEADGANIHQIGKSTLFEGHSTVMPDGRILYDRWEYVDRNFGDAQGLWTCNPDGTAHALYWGNNTASPGGVIDARIIPGTQLSIAILGSCHDRPWGALAIIDRRRGVDGKEPIVRTWPEGARRLVEADAHSAWDRMKRVRPKYEDPYPLNENSFLCARQTGRGEEMGIYYLDLYGNEILVHAEAPGCYDPMVLRPRERPAVIPIRRNYESPHALGKFYLQDVYIGTHMQGVEPGSIKYLRVVESPEKRSWTSQGWGGQGIQPPAMNWHNFENKRILGTVPVEEDGSAYFEVPGNTFVFFQALDRDKKMVQSMRSGTYVQPGERYGCIGCHENRIESAPHDGPMPQAVKRKPDEMNGWHGPPRLFSFQEEVQPVFNRNCVSCHDYGKKAGEKLNLAEDRTIVFNASYTDLWSKNYVNCIGAGPAAIQPAKSWGSHASQLVKVLENGHPEHGQLELTNEEMERIVTWVDLNAPYYPTYDSAYPNGPGGRSPIGDIDGVSFVTNHKTKKRAQVSFERPELSRCLKNFDKDSPKRAQALAAIKKGRRRLRERPRADMEGFVPSEIDQARETKYEERREWERRVYRAIRAGTKIYDPGLPQPSGATAWHARADYE